MNWILAVSALSMFVAAWIVNKQRRRILQLWAQQLELDIALRAARKALGDDLPEEDAGPPGWQPPELVREISLRNGFGGMLKLRVRGHAFRIVSFSRPPLHSAPPGPGQPKEQTLDLWMPTADLIEALQRP